MKGFARAVAVGLALSFAVSCTGRREPIDLLRAQKNLVEASAPGLDTAGVRAQMGAQHHLWDVSQLTLPGGPPSRLRFALDLPKGGRLTFTTAIAAAYQTRPAVEFVVKVVEKGREQVVFSTLLDPISRADHRGFVPGEVDLGPRSGPTELLFETRGFEEGGDPASAFWGAPAIGVASHEAPLAILYLVDTLRADHTGPYGYERPTTPELDRFAQDAVVFEAAVAHASWTKPSVASILTSRLPGQHRAVQLRDPLESAHVLVSEMLHAKGFSTGASLANSVIYLPESNFDRGFDYFAGLHGEEGRPSKLVDAARVVDTALRWLDMRRGMPNFLYVHTMDPHVPYSPPPPFDRMFEPHPTPEHPGTDPRSDYKEPLDRDRMIAQYDGDVAYGDQEFGRFVRELKARGLYDRALIVFLADHGEEFLDHGQWLHGRSLFDELIRIPLIVKFPGQRDAGRRVAQQVQGVDVLPTILAAMGLPVPPAPVIAGRPLQETLSGEAPKREAIAEISHRGIVAHGVRTEADKFIRRFNPERDELYFDLAKDPGEKTSVLEAASERVRRLRARAEEAMMPNPFRHVLRLAGADAYALTLRTGGWIEQVQATGLGQGERFLIAENGRRLDLRARPRPGQPREVAFETRPQGVPVWLEGSRAGRPLRQTDITLGDGRIADAIPFRLPEVDSDSEAAHAPAGLFKAPAGDAAGIKVWLVLPPGRKLVELDAETRERLKALGYLP
ncbi:MAG TPA: sulfatase [Vicinamibacteria bacterium]